MNRTSKVSLMVFVSVIFGGSAFAADSIKSCDSLHQFSTFAALISGVYTGDMTISSLAEQGPDGIGVFDSLDGSMVGIDGVFYHTASNGETTIADPSKKITYAQIGCLANGNKVHVENISSYEGLKSKLDNQITNKNVIYLIKIKGFFTEVMLSNISEKSKFYRRLDYSFENKTHYGLKNTEGTLVGIWAPEFMGNMSAPGYHLHMINKERTRGGHLINIKIDKADILIKPMAGFCVNYPQTEHYQESVITSIDRVE